MGLWFLTPLPGVLKFVLLGGNVPEGGRQPPPVVDLVDEVQQPLDYVFHRFVFLSVHPFVLKSLEEALGGLGQRWGEAQEAPSPKYGWTDYGRVVSLALD